MARKKKQEVILLHGKSQFNMQAAQEVNLKLGELVVEHSEDGDVKLHALNNAGNGLGTFVTETKVDGKVKVVADKVHNLETVVGDESKGLVKGVADNTQAISDLQDALGMGGTSGTGVTARVKALEDAVGNASVKDDSGNTVTEATGLFADVEANTAAIASQGGRLTTVEGKAEANANEITALKETVNGDGDGTGLVDKVAANKTAITKNAAAIDGLDKIVKGYDEPVEGGEEGATKHVAGLVEKVAALEDLMGDTDDKGSIVDRVAGAESKISNLETLVGSKDDGLVKDVADLQATVGDKDKGLVKDVNDLETTVSGHTTKINEIADAVGTPSVPGEGNAEGTPPTGLFAAVEANTAAIESLEAQIGTVIEDALGELNEVATEGEKLDTTYVSYVEQENGLIKPVYKTLDAANVKATYPKTGGTETTVQAALDDLNATDLNLGGQIEAVDARIDAILGSDKATGQNAVQLTIRQIANAELAAQLIPSGATEARDTLQEIAAWIQEHPEDAAAMNADIANLKTALNGYLVVGENGKVTVTDVKAVVDKLSTDLTNKDAELNNAITALTGTVTANKNEIDAYTVNGKKISENPSLVSGDIKMTTVVGAEEGTTGQTVQEAIAQVQTNVTTVSKSVETVDGRIDAISIEGTGIVVNRNADKFTININVIDAGSYDDDGTTEA